MQIPATPFTVGLWPVPGFAMMSYASAVEPFRAANLLAGAELYRVIHFSNDLSSQSSGAGSVAASQRVGDVVPLDLFLVIAGGDPFRVDDPGALAWLRLLAARVPVVGGVSGGAVLLARAGLLNGRRMTVHWEHAAQLGNAFPDLLIERRLFVMDRDRVTCGGGTAPLDLMHALIADHHGGPFAQLVSDWFLHTDVRVAAAPQRPVPSPVSQTGPAPLRAALLAMENHVGDPLSLSQLALMSNVSARHLNRLFQTELGQSAMAFYRSFRLDVGRRLVKQSAMPIKDIADATGFAGQSHFSNAYFTEFGCRPVQDRARTAPVEQSDGVRHVHF